MLGSALDTDVLEPLAHAGPAALAGLLGNDALGALVRGREGIL